MKHFYQKIELDAQTNELSYQKTKNLELESKLLILKEINGQFLLSKNEKFLINKQIIKINELSLKIKSLEIDFQKRFLSEPLSQEAVLKHQENLASLKINLNDWINLLHENHTKTKLKPFFEIKINLTEVEKQIVEKVDLNLVMFKKLNTWEKLKSSMVKTQKILNNEHINWFESMKSYRNKKGVVLSFNALND